MQQKTAISFLVLVVIAFILLKNQTTLQKSLFSLEQPTLFQDDTTVAAVKQERVQKAETGYHYFDATISWKSFNFTEANDYLFCCGRPDGPCEQTCFTKRACHYNLLFPFSTPEEQEWFKSRTHEESIHGNGTLLSWCSNYMSQNKWSPEPTWCQLPWKKRRVQVDHIPTGCSARSSMGIRSGPFDRLILFPKAKLAFCGIPKVGVTQWLKFLRFTFGGVDYLSVPYYKQDVDELYFDRLHRHRQLEILTDDSWTKAIFLREPTERLLSAYLDKIQGKKILKERFPTFADFVHDLETHPNPQCDNQTGPTYCFDPHWRPQYYSCASNELLPMFDFVGSMDHAANHTKALLEKVGLWDDFGALYHTSSKIQERENDCETIPPDPMNLEEGEELLWGFQQDLRSNLDGHARHSKSKLDAHVNETVLQRVKQMYRHDFALWDALNQHKGSWVTGKTLAAQLNPLCQG